KCNPLQNIIKPFRGHVNGNLSTKYEEAYGAWHSPNNVEKYPSDPPPNHPAIHTGKNQGVPPPISQALNSRENGSKCLSKCLHICIDTDMHVPFFREMRYRTSGRFPFCHYIDVCSLCLKQLRSSQVKNGAQIMNRNGIFRIGTLILLNHMRDHFIYFPLRLYFFHIVSSHSS